MDWSQCGIVDGWAVRKDAEGATLAARIYASDPSLLPSRGDALPVEGPCAAPRAYLGYVVAESSMEPLSGAGPYVADVRARASLSSHHAVLGGSSLLDEHTIEASFEDFEIDEDSVREFGALSGTAVRGGPGTRSLLQVTVGFYVRYRADRLASWKKTSCVVSGFPSWLKLPSGSNRWRIWDERIELVTDSDTSTRLWHVTRTLLGIPDNLVSNTGSRLQWNPSVIGSRSWDDLG